MTGPEGNGVSLGKGGEGGPSPAPQEARKISSQCSAREEATWRTDKSGVMKKDQRE